jgi:hypothetical protein
MGAIKVPQNKRSVSLTCSDVRQNRPKSVSLESSIDWSESLGPRIDRRRHETLPLGQAGDGLSDKIHGVDSGRPNSVSRYFSELGKKNPNELVRPVLPISTGNG